MDIYNTNTLIDEQTGNLAFKLSEFESSCQFCDTHRLNYYSLIWIKKGRGTAQVDFSEYTFTPNTLIAVTPYQPFAFTEDEPLEGVVLNFHPDFFCIHKHHEQVACNGVLFNNIYSPPMLCVTDDMCQSFELVLEQMYAEVQKSELAQYELLVSYLKIFLITASRAKAKQQPEALEGTPEEKEPFILQKLKNLIETHYKTMHSAGEYADLLNISPKALAKMTKNHFNKTMTNLISERIIIEAKRELYLTNKTVKEIAYDLGYDDEHYFSRFFKNNADISPKTYRETVGFARAAMA
ncbi:helix-turn-helix domain-containing protein [Allomuricauda sp. NBRC 101325]|uniref:helix-turn-helix domain-containing protein n=1 Tax=Allomuricauda sp. NBRC 101325 TaxID=1113758 RepID=UPI0024A49EC7|nr:helix-turn-helix domain-containing protein [Muricauda sp. NBRC 101325]GLU44731.1 AraC family transcriptional regulator [Muricauda sp. NBRC 101325]